MIQRVARAELAEARAKRFCPYCYSNQMKGPVLLHYRGCKIVTDACIKPKHHAKEA